MDDGITPFWMVLADNSEYTRVRHRSFESARAEAKRLAAQNKGVRFFVLSCCGAAIVRDPVDWIQIDDGLPF